MKELINLIRGKICRLEKRVNNQRNNKWEQPLIKRLANRVDIFSVECKECRSIKDNFKYICTRHYAESEIINNNDNNYELTTKQIIHHLKKKHRLVIEKQYVRRLVFASLVFGLILILIGYGLLYFGITLLALSVTIPALFGRVIFSYTLGYLLDLRAKKQGRVI
ncbi:MAG: hypothetical protein JSV74_00255 [Dehalococcoidia bacterium]|nr:MAG: hypothetical protein JSV74_00255 [Dehalococcoidia bacterium]